MAAYYSAPRRHAPPVDPPLHPQPHARTLPSLALADSSIYIFPNPSSAPASPSRASVLSDSSNISFSEISVSELGSPGYSLLFTPDVDPGAETTSMHPLSSLPSPLKSRVDDQGLRYNLDHSLCLGPVNPVLLEAKTFDSPREDSVNRYLHSPSLPHSKMNFRHPLFRLSTTSTPLPQHRQGKLPRVQLRHPLPRLSVPFLSFFSALLGVEDSTIDLLTLPSSTTSILYPAGKLQDLDTQEEIERPPALHGVEKLLSTAANEDGRQSVRQGLLFLDVLPIGEFSLAPFSSVWNVVNDLVSSGRSVLTYLALPNYEVA